MEDLPKALFGGENIRNAILALLTEKQVDFKHLLHGIARTASEGVAQTSISKEKGIKSLVIRGKRSGKNYLAAVLGHQRLNMDELSALTQEKCTLESLQEVNTRFGIGQGGVPPFGNLLGLRTFFDESILSLKECIIGCGIPSESIILPAEYLLALAEPEIGKIAI